MNFLERSVRNKLLSIAGIGTFLVILATLLGFWQSWRGIDIFRDDVGRDYGNAVLVLTMQSDFKKQVQEWKDTLLRGSDPAARAK